MPPLIKIFSLKGTKYAFLVLGMLLAVGWVLVWFELVNRLIVGYGESVTGVDTTLMLGVFIGLIGVGFLTSMIAKDRRGLTYGVYAGLAGMAISGVMLWRSVSGILPLCRAYGSQPAPQLPQPAARTTGRAGRHLGQLPKPSAPGLHTATHKPQLRQAAGSIACR